MMNGLAVFHVETRPATLNVTDFRGQKARIPLCRRGILAFHTPAGDFPPRWPFARCEKVASLVQRGNTK